MSGGHREGAVADVRLDAHGDLVEIRWMVISPFGPTGGIVSENLLWPRRGWVPIVFNQVRAE